MVNVKFCILLLIIFAASCIEPEKPVVEQSSVDFCSDALVNDEKFAAKSLPFLFDASGKKLVGRILMASNRELKPTIVFLHGNPGFEKNEDVGQALRRVGYNSVFFSYSGTWGNEGVFNYENAINDLHSLVDYLVNNAKRFRIDEQHIYAVGFSMGADIAILSAKGNDKIGGVVSIDPWNGYYELSSKSESELNQYKANLEMRPCINIESGSAFVSSILDNDSMDLFASLSEFSKPIVHIFSSEVNQSEFIENCNVPNSNCVVIEASDHSFSNKRMALTSEVAGWFHQHIKVER